MSESPLRAESSRFLLIAENTGICVSTETPEIPIDTINKDFKPYKEEINGCIAIAIDAESHFGLKIFPEKSLRRHEDGQDSSIGVRFYCRFDERRRNGGDYIGLGDEGFQDLLDRFLEYLQELKNELFLHLEQANVQINAGKDVEFGLGGQEAAGTQRENDGQITRWCSSQKMQKVAQDILRNKGKSNKGIPSLTIKNKDQTRELETSEEDPVRAPTLVEYSGEVRKGTIDRLSKKDKNFLLIGDTGKEIQISYDPNFEDALRFCDYNDIHIEIYVKEKYYKLSDQTKPVSCDMEGFTVAPY